MGISHKTNRKWLAIAVGCLNAMSLSAATAKFGVKLIDADTHVPIEGAKVVGYFENDNGWKAWTEAPPEYTDEKFTDKNGLCWLKGETNNGDVGFHVRNPPKGFYPNMGVGHRFVEKPLLPLLHWRPTDLVITAKLQRVEHPVPLFVKRTAQRLGSESIAKNGRSFAYDLVKGSFLPPFGKGEVADIVFTSLPLEYVGEGFNGRDLRAPRYKNTVIAFFQGDVANGIWLSSPLDQQAFLKIREAPNGGYRRELSLSESTSPDLLHREGLDDNNCYCFRIRVERNENGEMKSALYGKIYGDPSFYLEGDDRWKQKIAGISFLYYLNPTPNDRNLEWDMKNNLCDQSGDIRRDTTYIPSVLP